MANAKIRTDGVILNQIDPNNAVAGQLYRDENSDALVSKDTSGDGETPVAGSADSVMLKTKQNTSGQTIPSGAPVGLSPNGGVIQADSDGSGGQQKVIGIALVEIADTAQGKIGLIGPNVANAITGRGFAPGEAIYLSESGDYTNNLGSLTGGDDSFVRIGYADCPAGEADVLATDLIMFAEVIARP